MSLEEEFDKRIAAIHGLNNSDRHTHNAGEEVMDIRHAEFQAMADVFLGENFDQAKLARVENMQIALREQQAVLYQRYETGKLSPEEYVGLFNTLLDCTFEVCEVILGSEDFLKLFGCPRSELAGFIDEETFLTSSAQVTEEVPHGWPDSNIQALIDGYLYARKSKDFACADELRQILTILDIELEETKDGVRWRRK